MTTTTRTEYGAEQANGRIVWPDSDGDLHIDGRYRLANTEVDAVDVADLVKAAANDSSAVRLVQRTIIVSTSEPSPVALPIPTAPGSIIRAGVGSSRRIFTATDFTEPKWFAPTSNSSARFAYSHELTDVEILFDAAEVAA